MSIVPYNMNTEFNITKHIQINAYYVATKYNMINIFK